MRFNNFLDDILGQGSKIKILRFLVRTRGEFSGRDINRGAKVSPQTAHQALRSLSAQHVVIMKKSGNTILYKLNTDNQFVNRILVPLFKYESTLLLETIRSQIKPIEAFLETVILYGSFAKEKEKPSSDIDLCAVLKKLKDKEKVVQYFDELNQKFVSGFGNIISPYLISQDDFRKKYKKNDQHIVAVVQTGKVVVGKTISEVLINA